MLLYTGSCAAVVPVLAGTFFPVVPGTSNDSAFVHESEARWWKNISSISPKNEYLNGGVLIST
jgi:hypothetical protein